MGGGALWATVHGVARSWTQLSNLTSTFSFDLTAHVLFQIPQVSDFPRTLLSDLVAYICNQLHQLHFLS